MTIRRDLVELERQGIARRTHGGAVRPDVSSHEDSFFQRLEIAVDDKERLAEAAVGVLAPGDAVFLDSSTTVYFAARRILRENLRCTLLTNGAPVIDLACESDAPQVELIGVGGTLRKLTRSFVGPQAVMGVQAHFADKALFSVRGITEDGYLTDPDSLEAEIKHSMIRHARHVVLMIDGSKIDRPALSAIGPLSEVDLVLATGLSRRTLSELKHAGVEVRAV